ncbi:hypothetical protein GC173_06035 [bacterium]|nr:hypothetical protein [bacterium]
MAADGPVSSGDQQDVSRRIDELNAKLDAAMAANATAKNVTRAVGILVAAAAVVGVYMILSPVYTAYQNRATFQDAMVKEIQATVVPAVEEEGKALLKEAIPMLQSVAMKKYQEREQEILAKSYNEVEAFLSEMHEFGANEFETRRVRIENSIIEKLKDEAPELRDQEEAEKIMANAAAAMNSAVERSLNTHFKVHIDSVNRIGNNLGVLEIPKEIEEMDDLALREELTNSLGVYATTALRHFLNPESREFLRHVSEDPKKGANQ